MYHEGWNRMSSTYLVLIAPLFWERHMCRPLSYANTKQRTYRTVESLRSWSFEELRWSIRDDYVIGQICISEHNLLIGEILRANHRSFFVGKWMFYLSCLLTGKQSLKTFRWWKIFEKQLDQAWQSLTWKSNPGRCTKMKSTDTQKCLN